MKVAGSLIVVTGGSSGLGAATTRHLVSRGARVLNLDRQKPTYSDISEEWVFWPGECDVGSEESVKAALEKGFAKLGGDKWPVRGCVNCAGFGTPAAVIFIEVDRENEL